MPVIADLYVKGYLDGQVYGWRDISTGEDHRAAVSIEEYLDKIMSDKRSSG